MSIEIMAIMIAGLLLVVVAFSEWKFHSESKKNKKLANGPKTNSSLVFNAVCDAMTANMRNWQERKNVAPEVFTLYYKLLAFGFAEVALEYKMSLTDMLIAGREEECPDVRKMTTMLERLLFLLMKEVDNGENINEYLRYSIMDMMNANISIGSGAENVSFASRQSLHSVESGQKVVGGMFGNQESKDSPSQRGWEEEEEDFEFAFRVNDEAKKYRNFNAKETA